MATTKRRTEKASGGQRARDRSQASHAGAGTERRQTGTRSWSARVARESDALDLEEGVFTKSDPAAVARSLKRSAERSLRRKSEPYRSAMSMLTFYINRAGDKLPARQRRVLERAKNELRKLFGRAPR